MYPATKTSYQRSVEEALNHAKTLAAGQGSMEMLVTGSLHLVGGALHSLQELQSEQDQITATRNGQR